MFPLRAEARGQDVRGKRDIIVFVRVVTAFRPGGEMLVDTGNVRCGK